MEIIPPNNTTFWIKLDKRQHFQNQTSIIIFSQELFSFSLWWLRKASRKITFPSSGPLTCNIWVIKRDRRGPPSLLPTPFNRGCHPLRKADEIVQGTPPELPSFQLSALTTLKQTSIYLNISHCHRGDSRAALWTSHPSYCSQILWVQRTAVSAIPF